MVDKIYSIAGKRVWVAGETGLVGRSLLYELKHHDVELLSAPHSALDLTNQTNTFEWILSQKPDLIFMAAARVGGIGANASYPADFIRDNLSIALNVIDGAHRAGVERLVFLGSSCIYPRDAVNPIVEDSLLTGVLEKTNEGYAIAKIAGLKLCEFYKKQYDRNYTSVMPTNLYGVHDNFDVERGHVIPSMMMKFMTAKKAGADFVTLWGTGAPMREFLHASDLAAALIVIAEYYDDAALINVGSGEEISIKDLAHLMARVTEFDGEIVFDHSKPDGTMRKLLNSSKIRALGWRAEIELEKGVCEVYESLKRKSHKLTNNRSVR